MSALARVLPANVAVIDEAITTGGTVLERLGALKDPYGYFAHRGWALGWGLGCALGVKLAWPDRPVLGLIGDGAVLYGAQALWSAARHRLPVVMVIANNAGYEILKACGHILNLPGLARADCPGLTIDRPGVDFVALARAFGVEAHRVAEPDELAERVRVAFAGDRPVVFDVPIAG